MTEEVKRPHPATWAEISHVVDPPSTTSSDPLTYDWRALIEFERDWPEYRSAHRGADKEDEIRKRFRISSARYYQRIERLMTYPPAVAEFADLIHRRARLREQAAERRARRRL